MPNQESAQHIISGVIQNLYIPHSRWDSTEDSIQNAIKETSLNLGELLIGYTENKYDDSTSLREKYYDTYRTLLGLPAGADISLEQLSNHTEVDPATIIPLLYTPTQVESSDVANYDTTIEALKNYPIGQVIALPTLQKIPAENEGDEDTYKIISYTLYQNGKKICTLLNVDVNELSQFDSLLTEELVITDDITNPSANTKTLGYDQLQALLELSQKLNSEWSDKGGY